LVRSGPLEASFSFGSLCVIEDGCPFLASDLSFHCQFWTALLQEPAGNGQNSSGGEQLSCCTYSAIPRDQSDPAARTEPGVLDLFDELTTAQLETPLDGLRVLWVRYP
jgi:hypothetical protein